jgi:nucleolar protein 56
MRIKEWYSWHFPELARIVSDNLIYSRLVVLLGNKNDVTDEHLPHIEEVTGDADLAK